MTSDYRPISQKSIPDRQKVGNSALAATFVGLTIALLIARFDAGMAAGLCFGCALAIAVDRVVRWRAGKGG